MSIKVNYLINPNILYLFLFNYFYVLNQPHMNDTVTIMFIANLTILYIVFAIQRTARDLFIDSERLPLVFYLLFALKILMFIGTIIYFIICGFWSEIFYYLLISIVVTTFAPIPRNLIEKYVIK